MGRAHVAMTLLALASLSACSRHTTPLPRSDAPPGKSITLGATRITPDDLTMSHDETLSFFSTSAEPLSLEFTQPKDQADRIKCHVADPKRLKAGEAPWAVFRMNGEGHLTANIPAGLFPSVCQLAPGSYVYIVKVMDPALMQAPGRLGQQGTITVK